MNFRHAKARQPEIIRAVQKDASYTTELSEDFSDILKLSGSRNWIKYNNICKLIAEITYHGFTSLNNLQSLGEEYTGIIQINNTYVSLPNKLIQFIAIILEFGGDQLYSFLLKKFEKDIAQNKDVKPEAKKVLLSLINIMKCIGPYIKTAHKTLFFFYGGKYQLSKRLTGINYILIRHWLRPDHSLFGYKVLGIITFLQLTISLLISLNDALKNRSNVKYEEENIQHFNTQCNQDVDEDGAVCNLCFEPRHHTSLTPCGHLFCWMCIMNWLDEKEECPVCREEIQKSGVIQLLNYS